ncbi:MAG: hypothetical protein WCB67_06505, partial [Solirubrobacteraceae bacterium]
TRSARQVEARRAPRRVDAARRPAPPPPEPGRGRGFRRFMALLALVAVFALVVIAAVVISNSTSNTVIHYQKVVAHDVNAAITQIQNLISQSTK